MFRVLFVFKQSKQSAADLLNRRKKFHSFLNSSSRNGDNVSKFHIGNSVFMALVLHTVLDEISINDLRDEFVDFSIANHLIKLVCRIIYITNIFCDVLNVHNLAKDGNS